MDFVELFFILHFEFIILLLRVAINITFITCNNLYFFFLECVKYKR